MFVCAFSVAQWANMDTLGADTSRTLYAAGKQELLDDPVGGGRFVKTVLISTCLPNTVIVSGWCLVSTVTYMKFHILNT